MQFPFCLGQIERDDIKFESVSNNLGRPLELTRQNTLISFKVLIAITKNTGPHDGMKKAIKEFQTIFKIHFMDVLILSVNEVSHLRKRFGDQGVTV